MTWNPSMLQKGMRHEYLVASVFQGQGYLVRRGVPLRYGPNGQDATDIDVLGIRFTPPFQPHRIICDCKDKQRSKPYERIFWAKGLASFVNAAEVYVSLPKSNLEIIKFARSGQVRILTQSVIEDYLAKLYNNRSYRYGLADASFAEALYGRLSPLLKKDKIAVSTLFQVRSLYLVDDPYISLNISMAIMKDAAEGIRESARDGGVSFEFWRFIAADLTVLTSLFILYIAADTIGLQKSDRTQHIIERLTYGDIAPAKAREIFGLSKELAHEAARILNPDVSREALLPYDIGKIEPPPYAPDIAGLVERAINSPTAYMELPQLMDFLLFEQAIKHQNFSEEEYRRTFEASNPEERLKVAWNIFYFLRETCGIDLKAFWPHNDNNMPKLNSNNLVETAAVDR